MQFDSADLVYVNLKGMGVDIPYFQAIQHFIIRGHNKGSILVRLIPRKGRLRIQRANENRGICPIPSMRSYREKDHMNLWLYGQWEIDTAFGANNSGVLCFVIEKRTRCGIIILLKNKESRTLCRAMAEKRSLFHCQTIVADRGTEFFHHSIFKDVLGADTFFCDAGCPQQKGQVESFIERIRYFLPKGMDFTHLTQYHVNAIQDYLNNRILDVLGTDPFDNNNSCSSAL